MNWLTSKIEGLSKTALNSASQISKVLEENDYDDDDDFDQQESVGITPQVVEFVQNVCQHPKTFLEFPLEQNERETIHILQKWEEKHAKIMIDRIEELNKLRFKLCPSHMRDDIFWYIYFMLIRNQLGNHKVLELEEISRINEERSKSQELQQTENQQEEDDSQQNNDPFKTPTKRKGKQTIPDSPLSPILELLSSPIKSSNSKGNDLEEFYESMVKDELNNSASFDEGIQPEMDNYFVTNLNIRSLIEETDPVQKSNCNGSELKAEIPHMELSNNDQ